MPARVYTLIVFVNNFLYILIITVFFVTMRIYNQIKTYQNEKKITFLLFAIVLCLPAWSQLRGDMNNDNQVDVTDVSIMIDMVLGKIQPNLAIADLDGNGQVDVSDVSALIDVVLGKEPGGGDEPSTKTFTVNGVSFTMVTVQGGTFTMGGTTEQGLDVQADELPVHQVTMSDYSIGQTEVTQELWL